MKLKFYFLIFLLIKCSNVFSNTASLEDFKNFSGVWMATEDSIARRNSFDEPSCRIDLIQHRRLFRVNVKYHKEDSEFFLKGDISLILEQLWSSEKNWWGRAFDRGSPFSYTTTDREYFDSDGFRFFYTGSIINENKIINDGYIGKEYLTITKIGDTTYLNYKNKIKKNDVATHTDCTFVKVAQ